MPRLVAGTTVGAVALTGALEASVEGDGLRVSGALAPVVSGHLAQLLVARAADEWCVLTEGEFRARELTSLDLTRRAADVVVDGVVVPRRRILSGLDTDHVRDVAAVLFAAEATGGS